MMQIRGTSNIQPTPQVDFAADASAVDGPANTPQIDITDQVDLSSEAQLIAGADNQSADRVAEIRQQIEAGQYETSEKLDVALQRLLNEIA